ncbi:hypothetical protein ZWY2020_034539 [Hordeum vulgare]|nr:hypothetical protein ZWY2020_034539 [Hordeum vulgare]
MKTKMRWNQSTMVQGLKMKMQSMNMKRWWNQMNIEDDDGVTHEYEEMETEANGQDDEVVAVLNDADVVEPNASHQLPMVDVHPSKPAEEPAHTQS